MTLLKTTQRPDTPVEPDELAAELRRERELESARRTDELARVRAEAGHGRARADVAEESRLAELARAEREADVRAQVELARMYREFRASGVRTQVRADMARSGEARALRLEWLRVRNLRVLVPILIGFGIWSTTGVQRGAAKIMQVDSGDAVWWTLWGLEALLIGAVCWIIIARARLSASGGTLSSHAERIGIGCLTTSIFLNLVAAVPTGDGAHVAGWAVPGAMFAHALGPVGAAVTAHLIGVIDWSIGEADPWHDSDGQAVPRLAEMDLSVPAVSVSVPVSALGENAPDADAENGPENGPEDAAENLDEVPLTVWPVPRGPRAALPVIAFPTPPVAAENGPPTAKKAAARTGGGRDEQPEPGTSPKRRPNKGVPVPEAAKPAPKTSRDRTDAELQEQLVGLLARGEIEPGVRAVKDALGVGYERAKRIMAALAEEATNKADNADLGDVARPLTVLAGGAR